MVVSVTRRGRRDSFVLDAASWAGKAHQARITVTASSVEVSEPVPARSVEAVEYDGFMVVTITVGGADGRPGRTLYERRLAYTVEGGSLRALLPGTVSVDELGGEDPVEPGLAPSTGGRCRGRYREDDERGRAGR